jgi:L-lactate dehydrogenase complex protein LldG
MAEVTGARDEILSRIRKSTAATNEAETEREWAGIQRSFRRTGTLTSQQRISLFCDRLHDYGAGVHESSREQLRTVISRVLAQRGKKTIIVPQAWPEDWMPVGTQAIREQALSYEALDQSEAVMTASTAAIAFTGTIVLRGGPLEGRRALSLIPDYHLCLVEADQIVELVPEALERLHAVGAAPLTFISGPSATADIEMMRVQGVHGPRTLDVVIVG